MPQIVISESEEELPKRRHPDWLKVPLPGGPTFMKLQGMLKKRHLHTICEEAKCPNIAECWGHGVGTFLILGDVCTRYCHYCHVKTGRPLVVDPEEPQKIAESVKELGLKYVVVTSVTRDDLPDGGAAHYAETIRAVHAVGCKIEPLIPDFRFNEDALKMVLDAEPDVSSHNIESPKRTFELVRKGGNFEKSLLLLKKSKEFAPYIPTKSGFMVGLGETSEEIIELLQQLREHEVDFITIGQYLQPTPRYNKIMKYYTPAEFKEFEQKAYSFGFKYVASGPLVRSSYRADKCLED